MLQCPCACLSLLRPLASGFLVASLDGSLMISSWGLLSFLFDAAFFSYCSSERVHHCGPLIGPIWWSIHPRVHSLYHDTLVLLRHYAGDCCVSLYHYIPLSSVSSERFVCFIYSSCASLKRLVRRFTAVHSLAFWQRFVRLSIVRLFAIVCSFKESMLRRVHCGFHIYASSIRFIVVSFYSLVTRFEYRYLFVELYISTESTHLSRLVLKCLRASADRCISFLRASYRVSESGGMTPTYILRRTEQGTQKEKEKKIIFPSSNRFILSERSFRSLSYILVLVYYSTYCKTSHSSMWYRHFLPFLYENCTHTTSFENILALPFRARRVGCGGVPAGIP